MTTLTNTVAQAHDRAKANKTHGDNTARTAAFIAILNADMIDRNSGITEPNEETPGSDVARLVLRGA